jgi:AraC-like DNA-binding protein
MTGASAYSLAGRTTIQLEPGALVVASTVRRFSDLRLQQTAVNRTSLHRVPAPLQSISLLLTLRGSATQFVGGYELTTDRCVLLEEGAVAELIAHAGSSWILISLPTGLMGSTERSCTAGQLQLHGGARLVTRPSNVCVTLADGAATALFSWRASTVRALAISLLQNPADSSIHAAPCNARDDGARRRIAVERARRYIWDHLADPIRLADLCAHAHLQARSLEYGFRQLVGLAPMAYVRMLRLGQVRAQLLQGEATRSISAIALDAGFTHLSQFVVDYKRVFGETPSTTRGSVLGPARIEIRRHWLSKPKRSVRAAVPQRRRCLRGADAGTSIVTQ